MKGNAVTGRTVLVVHDDPKALGRLEELLAGEEYDVLTASYGAEGLARAAEAPPAAVLVRTVLPDMDGFEVCRRLKASPRTRCAEVVFLLPAGDGSDRAEGLAAGGMDFLDEPVDALELTARVRTAVRLAEFADIAVADERDALTGLWSRRHFEMELQRECNRARRYDSLFALVLLDIDDFGAVVAEHGEAFGRRLLREVADILTSRTRQSDCVARWGHDEFILLLPEGNLPKAIGLAKKLFAAVESHDFTHDGRAVRISVSMGVASRQNIGGRDPGDMLRLARQCLEEARSAGGDGIFYHTCGEMNPVRT